MDELDLTDAPAVVATVGTTSTTSVDPVTAIADACAVPRRAQDNFARRSQR